MPCRACGLRKFNYPQSAESEDWKGIIWTDHPDVGMVVAPKRVLQVDQMRAMEREANFRPFEGKARMFLIEDADKLNDSSANALLKVLEEPPAYISHRFVDLAPGNVIADDSFALPDDPVLAIEGRGNRKIFGGE